MSEAFESFKRDVKRLLNEVREKSGEIAPREILYDSTDQGKLPPSNKKRDVKLSLDFGFELPSRHPDGVGLKNALQQLSDAHKASLKEAHGLSLEVTFPKGERAYGSIRLVLPHGEGGAQDRRQQAFEHMREFEFVVRDAMPPVHFKFVPRRRPV